MNKPNKEISEWVADSEESDDQDVSLENLKEEEAKESPDIKEDTEATNS